MECGGGGGAAGGDDGVDGDDGGDGDDGPALVDLRARCARDGVAGWYRGFGQLNARGGHWRPEWVTIDFVVWRPGSPCAFSVLWPDDHGAAGGPCAALHRVCRQLIDFVPFGAPRRDLAALAYTIDTDDSDDEAELPWSLRIPRAASLQRPALPPSLSWPGPYSLGEDYAALSTPQELGSYVG